MKIASNLPNMKDFRKAEQIGFRIPAELKDRIKKLCATKPKVQQTQFYLEAIRFYLEHAERFGIDEDLRPNLKSKSRSSAG